MPFTIPLQTQATSNVLLNTEPCPANFPNLVDQPGFNDYCSNGANIVPSHLAAGTTIITHQNNYAGLAPLSLNEGFLLGRDTFSEGQYQLLIRLLGQENVRLVYYQGPGHLIIPYRFFENRSEDAYQILVNDFRNYASSHRFPSTCRHIPLSNNNECEHLTAGQIQLVEGVLEEGKRRVRIQTNSNIARPAPIPNTTSSSYEIAAFLGSAMVIGWALVRSKGNLLVDSAKAIADTLLEGAYFLRHPAIRLGNMAQYIAQRWASIANQGTATEFSNPAPVIRPIIIQFNIYIEGLRVYSTQGSIYAREVANWFRQNTQNIRNTATTAIGTAKAIRVTTVTTSSSASTATAGSLISRMSLGAIASIGSVFAFIGGGGLGFGLARNGFTPTDALPNWVRRPIRNLFGLN